MPITPLEYQKFRSIMQTANVPGMRTILLETRNRASGERVLLLAYRYETGGRVDIVPYAELLMDTPHDKYEQPENLPLMEPVQVNPLAVPAVGAIDERRTAEVEHPSDSRPADEPRS